LTTLVVNFTLEGREFIVKTFFKRENIAPSDKKLHFMVAGTADDTVIAVGARALYSPFARNSL
jgi:hypothetical protein